MSGLAGNGTERCRTYEGRVTVSLELALSFGLAHLLELGPFGKDFHPLFVGYDSCICEIAVTVSFGPGWGRVLLGLVMVEVLRRWLKEVNGNRA